MSTEIVGHLDRRRLRAERVGLAQQLLDQELQALADLAALVEQARDLVEVRAQPRQLLGDVDADRVGRRLVERALLDRFARHRLRRAGLVERFLPALEEALLLPRSRRAGTSGSAASARARRWATRSASTAASRSPSRARATRQPLDAALGRCEDGVLGLRLGRAAAPLQRLVHRERRAHAAGARARRLSTRARWRELLGRRLGHAAFGAARAADAQLDLAALEARREQCRAAPARGRAIRRAGASRCRGSGR